MVNIFACWVQRQAASNVVQHHSGHSGCVHGSLCQGDFRKISIFYGLFDLKNYLLEKCNLWLLICHPLKYITSTDALVF